MTPRDVLSRLIQRQDLTREEARTFMSAVMCGEIPDVQSAAILTALALPPHPAFAEREYR